MNISRLINALEIAAAVDPDFEVSVDESLLCIVIPPVRTVNRSIAPYAPEPVLSAIYLEELPCSSTSPLEG